jgi:hypothetical protein
MLAKSDLSGTLSDARPHKSLANPYPRTPAMAAGLENHIWTIEDIVRLADKSSETT